MDYRHSVEWPLLPLWQIHLLHQPLMRLAQSCHALTLKQDELAVRGKIDCKDSIAVVGSRCNHKHCRMATTAIAPQSNGVGPAGPADQTAWELSQYEKIMEIRDQVFAGTHPRLKLLTPVSSIKYPQPPPPEKAGITALPPPASQIPPSSTGRFHPPPPPPNVQSRISSNVPSVAATATSIDPIFLTKSDVLLKAETQQRRQRIERVLADQVKEKQATSKQRAFDQDDLPDFNVTEVLRKAQELVKPVKFTEISGANGNASASDSFDENTFYSSQMNDLDSTPELADKPEPPRKGQDCKFFARGDDCPYGEQCIYAHNPATRRNAQEQVAQVQVVDRRNTDPQARPSDRRSGQQSVTHDNTEGPSPAELAAEQRIAQLEAELRALRNGQLGPPTINTSTQEVQEEDSVYSPPDAFPPKPNDESSGRKTDQPVFHCRRCPEKFPSNSKLHLHVAAHHTKKKGDKSPETPTATRTRQQQRRRTSAHVENSDREFPREENAVGSPMINEGRVVRNQITSPVAPQPARVSPLAVARMPPISQTQGPQRQIDEDVRGPANGTIPAPNGQNQAANPRKRRRGRDSGERTRNVVARREPPSPGIRIKEEPMSPGPFTEPIEVWEPRGRPEDRGPIYVDEISPRYINQDSVIHRPSIIDRPAPRYILDEPDLRRIVSTRQARGAPQTQAVNERYPSPHLLLARAPSRVYVPRQDAEAPRRYRTSVQPEVMPYVDRDSAPSPRFREVSTMMAPPPRRIVVDQYGNQFYEHEVAPMPMPRPRQSSVVAYPRPTGHADESYQLSGPRQSIARIPQPLDNGHASNYIRNGPSPPPSRYVEFVPPTHRRQPVDRSADVLYGNEPQLRREDGRRMIEYAPPHANGRYEEVRPVEGITRISSVRPVSHQYEGGPERLTRVQSVHPEGRRVVSLGNEAISRDIRHTSVRPDDPYARPMEYAPPRPQYYDNRG